MSFNLSGSQITQSNDTSKSITAIASVTGGIRVTVSSHGYSNDDVVEHSGTTDYDGVFRISNVQTNTYDIVNQDLTFGVTRTGSTAKGDVDLSGLTSITGVNTTNLCTNNYLRRVVELPDMDLKVNGALVLDKDTLIINRTDTSHTASLFEVNGTFRLGRNDIMVTRSSGNVKVYSDLQCGLIIRRYVGTSWEADDKDFNIKSGGHLECFGGKLESTVAFDLEDGSFMKLRNANWTVTAYDPMATDGDYLNILLHGTIDIDGWKLVGNEYTIIGFLGTISKFLGYDPARLKEPVGFVTGRGDIVDFDDYTAGKSVMDVKIRVKSKHGTNGGFNIYGSNLGNDMLVVGKGGDQSRGRVWHFIKYKPKIVDLDGDAVSGANLYLIDSDSGNRDTTGPGGVPDDQVYTKTSDSNGDVSRIDILTGVWSNYNNTDLVNFTVESRLPVNGRSWHYNYLPQVITLTDSKIIGTLSPKIQMLSDPYITQSNKTTVTGYSHIDDLSMFYDRSKAWKVDSSNITYPSYTEFLVEGSGKKLDLDDCDLVIDTGATATFAVNKTSDVITIKPTDELDVSIKFNEIATSGDITFNTDSIGDDIKLTGTVYLKANQDISGVIITGDLHIDINADTTLEFDNVNISGDVYNDNSSHTLTINAINGASITAGDAGTGDGQTSIKHPVDFKFTVNPSITGYEWRIYEVTALGSLTGAIEKAGQETATADNQTYTYDYSTNKNIAVQIISQPDEDYLENISYYTLGASSQDTMINLIKDTNN